VSPRRFELGEVTNLAGRPDGVTAPSDLGHKRATYVMLAGKLAVVCGYGNAGKG
jgi:hypothetical protein